MVPDVQQISSPPASSHSVLLQNFTAWIITCRVFSASSEEKRGGETAAQVRAGLKVPLGQNTDKYSASFSLMWSFYVEKFPKNKETGLESLAPPTTSWVSIQMERKLVTCFSARLHPLLLCDYREINSSFHCRKRYTLLFVWRSLSPRLFTSAAIFPGVNRTISVCRRHTGLTGGRPAGMETASGTMETASSR